MTKYLYDRLLLLSLFLLVRQDIIAIASSSSGYSYNTNANYNPKRWQLVSTDATNQCDESRQSPIAIGAASPSSQGQHSKKCTVFEDMVQEYVSSDECNFRALQYSITDHNLEASVVAAAADQEQQQQQPCSWKDGHDNWWTFDSLHVHLGWEHRSEESIDDESKEEEDSSSTRPPKQLELHLVHSLAAATSGNENNDDNNSNNQKLVVAIRFEALQQNKKKNSSKKEGDHPILAQLVSQWLAVPSECANNDDNVEEEDVSQENNQQQESSDYDHVYSFLSSTTPTTMTTMLTEPIYRYQGSFTTPPCTQSVTWLVLQRARSMSVSQFDTLTRLVAEYRNEECALATVASQWNTTARPLQALNGRTVDLICSPSTRVRHQRLVTILAVLFLVSGVAVVIFLRKKRLGSALRERLASPPERQKHKEFYGVLA